MSLIHNDTELAGEMLHAFVNYLKADNTARSSYKRDMNLDPNYQVDISNVYDEMWDHNITAVPTDVGSAALMTSSSGNQIVFQSALPSEWKVGSLVRFDKNSYPLGGARPLTRAVKVASFVTVGGTPRKAITLVDYHTGAAVTPTFTVSINSKNAYPVNTVDLSSGFNGELKTSNALTVNTNVTGDTNTSTGGVAQDANSTGSGSGAQFTVATGADGQVSSVTCTNAGTGYSVGDQLLLPVSGTSDKAIVILAEADIVLTKPRGRNFITGVKLSSFFKTINYALIPNGQNQVPLKFAHDNAASVISDLAQGYNANAYKVWEVPHIAQGYKYKMNTGGVDNLAMIPDYCNIKFISKDLANADARTEGNLLSSSSGSYNVAIFNKNGADGSEITTTISNMVYRLKLTGNNTKLRVLMKHGALKGDGNPQKDLSITTLCNRQTDSNSDSKSFNHIEDNITITTTVPAAGSVQSEGDVWNCLKYDPLATKLLLQGNSSFAWANAANANYGDWVRVPKMDSAGVSNSLVHRTFDIQNFTIDFTAANYTELVAIEDLAKNRFNADNATFVATGGTAHINNVTVTLDSSADLLNRYLSKLKADGSAARDFNGSDKNSDDSVRIKSYGVSLVDGTVITRTTNGNSSTAVITLNNTTGLVAGMGVSATGDALPKGVQIDSVDASSNQITLTQAPFSQVNGSTQLTFKKEFSVDYFAGSISQGKGVANANSIGFTSIADALKQFGSSAGTMTVNQTNNNIKLLYFPSNVTDSSSANYTPNTMMDAADIISVGDNKWTHVIFKDTIHTTRQVKNITDLAKLTSAKIGEFVLANGLDGNKRIAAITTTLTLGSHIGDATVSTANQRFENNDSYNYVSYSWFHIDGTTGANTIQEWENHATASRGISHIARNSKNFVVFISNQDEFNQIGGLGTNGSTSNYNYAQTTIANDVAANANVSAFDVSSASGIKVGNIITGNATDIHASDKLGVSAYVTAINGTQITINKLIGAAGLTAGVEVYFRNTDGSKSILDNYTGLVTHAKIKADGGAANSDAYKLQYREIDAGSVQAWMQDRIGIVMDLGGADASGKATIETNVSNASQLSGALSSTDVTAISVDNVNSDSYWRSLISSLSSTDTNKKISSITVSGDITIPYEGGTVQGASGPHVDYSAKTPVKITKNRLGVALGTSNQYTYYGISAALVNTAVGSGNYYKPSFLINSNKYVSISGISSVGLAEKVRKETDPNRIVSATNVGSMEYIQHLLEFVRRTWTGDSTVNPETISSQNDSANRSLNNGGSSTVSLLAQAITRGNSAMSTENAWPYNTTVSSKKLVEASTTIAGLLGTVNLNSQDIFVSVATDQEASDAISDGAVTKISATSVSQTDVERLNSSGSETQYFNTLIGSEKTSKVTLTGHVHFSASEVTASGKNVIGPVHSNFTFLNLQAMSNLSTNTTDATVGTTTENVVISATNGAGTIGSDGAKFTILTNGSGGVTSATATAAGSGYAVGDTLTLAVPGASSNLVITLAAADLYVSGLVGLLGANKLARGSYAVTVNVATKAQAAKFKADTFVDNIIATGVSDKEYLLHLVDAGMSVLRDVNVTVSSNIQNISYASDFTGTTMYTKRASSANKNKMSDYLNTITNTTPFEVRAETKNKSDFDKAKSDIMLNSLTALSITSKAHFDSVIAHAATNAGNDKFAKAAAGGATSVVQTGNDTASSGIIEAQKFTYSTLQVNGAQKSIAEFFSSDRTVGNSYFSKAGNDTASQPLHASISTPGEAAIIATDTQVTAVHATEVDTAAYLVDLVKLDCKTQYSKLTTESRAQGDATVTVGNVTNLRIGDRVHHYEAAGGSNALNDNAHITAIDSTNKRLTISSPFTGNAVSGTALYFTRQSVNSAGISATITVNMEDIFAVSGWVANTDTIDKRLGTISYTANKVIVAQVSKIAEFQGDGRGGARNDDAVTIIQATIDSTTGDATARKTFLEALLDNPDKLKIVAANNNPASVVTIDSSANNEFVGDASNRLDYSKVDAGKNIKEHFSTGDSENTTVVTGAGKCFVTVGTEAEAQQMKADVFVSNATATAVDSTDYFHHMMDAASSASTPVIVVPNVALTGNITNVDYTNKVNNSGKERIVPAGQEAGLFGAVTKNSNTVTVKVSNSGDYTKCTQDDPVDLIDATIGSADTQSNPAALNNGARVTYFHNILDRGTFKLNKLTISADIDGFAQSKISQGNAILSHLNTRAGNNNFVADDLSIDAVMTSLVEFGAGSTEFTKAMADTDVDYIKLASGTTGGHFDLTTNNVVLNGSSKKLFDVAEGNDHMEFAVAKSDTTSVRTDDDTDISVTLNAAKFFVNGTDCFFSMTATDTFGDAVAQTTNGGKLSEVNDKTGNAATYLTETTTNTIKASYGRNTLTLNYTYKSWSPDTNGSFSGDATTIKFTETAKDFTLENESTIASCFLAGTMVNTPSGLRAIETLRQGDKVNSSRGVSTVDRLILSSVKPVDESAVFTIPQGAFGSAPSAPVSSSKRHMIKADGKWKMMRTWAAKRKARKENLNEDEKVNFYNLKLASGTDFMVSGLPAKSL